MKDKYLKLKKEKVQRLLRKTDWMSINCEGILTTEQQNEIKIYRQQLRDVNLNNPNDHTKWVFPEIPSWVNHEDLED